MTGEIQFIKKQIFGGFNRKDVVAYVAKMARERNEAREANKEITEKMDELVSEIETLKLELEKSKTRPDRQSFRHKAKKPIERVSKEQIEQPVIKEPAYDNRDTETPRRFKAKIRKVRN